MQRPGRDARRWRVLRACLAKPSYLGGLPGEGSQAGPPHTGGGSGFSARPLLRGAGAGPPADWPQALMDSRHVPPPGSAGLAPGRSWDGQTHVCLFRLCCQGGLQWSFRSESSPQPLAGALSPRPRCPAA
ncbi:uncharacterized protein [Macaca nemestrina]|uniref:uncharacterized protein n=1 Tax=Macaca nemestrina TaxID=9545 RepID=UPI0039B97251